MLHRLRSAKDEEAEALAMTLEVAEWLRSRVNGLQVTWFHGTPGNAERLLAALAARMTERPPRGISHV
jgi:hypothetical protein